MNADPRIAELVESERVKAAARRYSLSDTSPPAPEVRKALGLAHAQAALVEHLDVIELLDGLSKLGLKGKDLIDAFAHLRPGGEYLARIDAAYKKKLRATGRPRAQRQNRFVHDLGVAWLLTMGEPPDATKTRTRGSTTTYHGDFLDFAMEAIERHTLPGVEKLTRTQVRSQVRNLRKGWIELHALLG